MDHVTLHSLDTPASVLGMGCASLGSRVGTKAAHAALDRAFEADVTWYDLAPAYGAGQAEEIFASFARDKRDRIQICTKVGLLPPKPSTLKRMLMPIARPIAGAIKPIRAAIKGSGVTANRAVTLTPELLLSSLDQSLIRLKTDHIDVYALHNVRAQDLQNDALMRTLEDIKTSGKARAIATASSHAAAAAGIASQHIDVVQLAHPDMPDGLIATAQAAGTDTITHSIFGVSGSLKALEAKLDPDTRAKLRDMGFQTAADLLLARARAANPAGLTLCSMMSARSLEANIRAAHLPLTPDAQNLCESLGV